MTLHIIHAHDLPGCCRCEHANLHGLTSLSILQLVAASGEPLVVQTVLSRLPHEEA